jgi:multidrug efflux system membrane fusion protein
MRPESSDKTNVDSAGASRAPPDAGAPRAMKRRRWPFVLGVVLVFAAVVSLVLLRHREADAAKSGTPPPPLVTITVATATKGTIGSYLDAIGTVTPVFTASIMSQVSGVIVGVHYREGQRVNKGDALIDIDARPYRATLLQAEGTLEHDTNLLAQAEMDLGRYRDAWQRNAIAKQTLDDQEKLVLQDRGTVKTDTGTVDYDQVQVDFCHITAPIAGRLGLRLVDPGNFVQPTGNVTLAVITQLDPITVIFTVPEDHVARVESRVLAGTRLTVAAYDRTGQRKLADGELLTIDNQIDTTTGTVKARAQFLNGANELYPNQFVNTRLLVDTVRDATLVETDAIQHNGAESYAYVIREDEAKKQSVKIGITDGAVSQVEGLGAGDVVATSGFDKLHDGVRVTVSGSPAPAPRTGSGSGAP